ncbi:hypothetical protein BZG36_01313 [Bifiguratus adelaidae]|uniref:Uncharacterized protein n=1 Tax=Bifiguratus adelaidae TaxID=1938954 RepID=A0A261Y556_9FUNG|nr:hypothetical protein BZG36_01313 [Bifiguratus adelaidae]
MGIKRSITSVTADEVSSHRRIKSVAIEADMRKLSISPGGGTCSHPVSDYDPRREDYRERFGAMFGRGPECELHNVYNFNAYGYGHGQGRHSRYDHVYGFIDPVDLGPSIFVNSPHQLHGGRAIPRSHPEQATSIATSAPAANVYNSTSSIALSQRGNQVELGGHIDATYSDAPRAYFG